MAAPTVGTLIESGLPLVETFGLNTLKNINFNSGSNTCDLPALTTINGVAVAGVGNISSSATTGNMFTITNTGVYTGTGVMTITANSATTGSAGLVLTANGLTTGNMLTASSSSADTGTRSLVKVTNSSAASTGTTGIEVANTSTGACLKTTTGLTSTHFQKVGVFGGVTLWVSDGTTANAALSGTAGDLCLNAGSNKPEYCTGTTNWTALV